MPISVMPYAPPITYSPPPRLLLGFRLLREGESTPTQKYLRLYRGWQEMDLLAVFTAGSESDGFTDLKSFDLATVLAQPDWLVAGSDDTPPHRTRAVYMDVSEGGVLPFNITSGSGGEVTDPALVDASVRVDRLPAVREVVVIERPATGEWRIAGRGQTDADGLASIDLAVTGGRVFALAVDDYGVPFSPGLVVTVGQRIRPSVFAGVLYEITEAGTLPATEPTWWPITVEDSRELGTGRAVARRYYRPLAHGPFPVELVDD